MIESSPVITDYWVLRGSFAPGVDVAWSDVAVLHPSGLIEPRLVVHPDGFTIGLPTAIGAPPERIEVQVEVDNADGGLDQWIVGAEQTAVEYLSPSFITFKGQIFRGVIAADGTITETAYTPTLAASGPITADRSKGTVALSLAHVDQDVLGPPVFLPTIRQLLAGTFVSGSADSGPVSRLVEALADHGVLSADDLWGFFRGADVEGEVSRSNVDAIAPFLYGQSTAPLIRVTAGSQYPACFLAGVGWDDPLGRTIDTFPLIYGTIGGETTDLPYDKASPIPFSVKLTIAMPDETTRDVWLALAIQVDEPSELDSTDTYYHVSDSWSNGIPGGSVSTPASILRKIIEDHSERGADGIDTASWDAAHAAQLRTLKGACAGYLKDSATLADLCESIAPIGDMGLWFDTDGRLRVALGGWSRDDAEEALTALPLLREPDVFPVDEDGTPGWSETIPTDPDDRGAVLSRVVIEWEQEQRELFPGLTSDDRAATLMRVDLAVQSEARVPGAWIDPRHAKSAIRAIASRGAFPTRRIRFTTHASIATLHPGAKLRITHPLGISAEGDYVERLVRVERIEVHPGERAATVTAEDLGPAEKIRAGLLDAIANWIKYQPPAGGTLALAPNGDGTSKATASGTTAFSGIEPGSSVWITSAANAANIGSWKVLSIGGTDTAIVEGDFIAETIVGLGAADPLDEAWLVVTTHEAEEPRGPFRPDYIRGCDTATGLLVGGEAGYQFTDR